jgi:hypothetical protein
MSDTLTDDQIEALIEALCSAFWVKRPFRDFLRRAGVSQSDLAQLDRGGTKREFLRWLFERYEQGPAGRRIMRDIAVALMAKTVFPGLEPHQVKVAQVAISALGPLWATGRSPRPEPTAASSVAPAAPPRPSINLVAHREKLERLMPSLGTAPGGRGFEEWFISLANDSGLTAREGYRTQYRQFDGSLNVGNNVYMLELKFTSEKSDAPAIGDFVSKVRGHAAGGLGLFLGMMGFTSNAVATASQAGSPIVLMDGAHLYRVLHGGAQLGTMIERLRRHAVETGEAYLPAQAL